MELSKTLLAAISAFAILVGINVYVFDPSPLQAAIIGGGTYIGIGCLLSRSNRAQCRASIAGAIRLVTRDKGWPAVSAMWLAIALLLATKQTPALEPVARFAGFFEMLGVIIALWTITWTTRSAIRSFSWLLLMYSATGWCIGAMGDGMYQISNSTMAHTLVGLAVLVGFGSICWHDRQERARTKDFVLPSGRTAASSSFASDEDRRRAAIHEAGHVLCYASVQGVPGDTHAVVRRKMKNGVLGYVYGLHEHSALATRGFIEWQMICLLAGREAERLLTGTTCLGSENDLERWTATAKSFLAAGDDIFYPNPANEFEHEHNLDCLRELRAIQVARVREFLKQNEPLLETLAETLLDKGRMDVDALRSFWTKAVVPSGFPVLDLSEHTTGEIRHAEA